MTKRTAKEYPEPPKESNKDSAAHARSDEKKPGASLLAGFALERLTDISYLATAIRVLSSEHGDEDHYTILRGLTPMLILLENMIGEVFDESSPTVEEWEKEAARKKAIDDAEREWRRSRATHSHAMVMVPVKTAADYIREHEIA